MSAPDLPESDASLRITEIFLSLQGEARAAGRPTSFVRLTGCPLRCNYCDSEYAFFGGERQSISSIVDQVTANAARHICVTGGEPLAQPHCIALLTRLCDQGFDVSLETSGAMDITAVDPRVSVVLDIKTPDSGEVDKNLWSNIELLEVKDQVKFVICSKSDFDWACFKITELALCDKVADVLVSPCHERVDPKDLAEWVIASKLDLRFQLQLHKLLWGDKPGV